MNRTILQMYYSAWANRRRKKSRDILGRVTTGQICALVHIGAKTKETLHKTLKKDSISTEISLMMSNKETF